MSDVFLSYAREDRVYAERVAAAIADRNLTVWWDRQIQLGKPFARVIEEELDAASCVVVLWSRYSVSSEWVVSEAAEGAQRSILVPILIEQVRIPLEFRRLQTADLTLWLRSADPPAGFADCIATIEAVALRNRDLQSTMRTAKMPPAGTGYQSAHELTVESLEVMLAEIWPAKNKNQQNEEYAELLEELQHFGITTSTRLREIVSAHHDAAMNHEAECVAEARNAIESGEGVHYDQERNKRGVFFSHVGLTRRALFGYFGAEWESYLSARFAQRSNTK